MQTDPDGTGQKKHRAVKSIHIKCSSLSCATLRFSPAVGDVFSADPDFYNHFPDRSGLVGRSYFGLMCIFGEKYPVCSL